jgi:glycosyltransferase involved in cell wall biosynthesis
MTKVGVYLGTVGDDTDNVVSEFTAWGRYLQAYDLEVFGSASLPDSAHEYYTVIETKRRSPRHPFLKVIQSYLDCREYIDRRSPDILVQLWKYKMQAPGIAIAGQQAGIPVVSRFAGDHFNEHEWFDGIQRAGVSLLDNLCKIPVALSNRMLVFGPYGRSEVIRNGMSRSNILIHPPPGDVGSRFRPPENEDEQRQALGLPTDKSIALYVGRLSDLKGMSFLQEAIGAVANRKEMLFVLVGDGPYKDHFETEYDDDLVRTIGYVPHDEIDEYYKSADVYLHPSPFEGLPLVILEALSCGMPVVAREAGDIGFVTPNIVRTPAEMAATLLVEDWREVFHNYRYFSEPYQRRTATDLIDELGSP